MNLDPKLVFAILGASGFVLGSFPTGVLISKQRYGIDVREMGSGNIGATNITRNFGWYAGALTFGIDLLKGFLPVELLLHFSADWPDFYRDWGVMILGLSLVLGHCYSVFLGFRGGKGVATTFGCVAAVFPKLSAVSALAYVLALAISRVSAIGSLAGLTVLVTYALTLRSALANQVLILSMCFVVLIRHASNIQRLLIGLRRRIG